MTHVRTDVVQLIIDHYGYTSYLEIGIGNTRNHSLIKCENKISVDPNGRAMYKMTSDKFFEEHAHEHQLDVIFIDGDHTKEQVEKDIDNSLKRLLPNGTIVFSFKQKLTGKMLKVARIGHGDPLAGALCVSCRSWGQRVRDFLKNARVFLEVC
mgnify:CR=1 FL=1